MLLRGKNRLLPHEVFFLLTNFVIAFRSVKNLGLLHSASLFTCSLVIFNILLLVVCAKKDTDVAWRIRLLFYPVLMTLLFNYFKHWVPLIQPAKEDEMLYHMDQLLIGFDISLWAQTWEHPLISDIVSFCYLAFFPIVYGEIIYHFFTNLETHKKFYQGMFTAYAIAYLGYIFIPALGPGRFYESIFAGPVPGYFMTAFNSKVVAAGTVNCDVFPSLHCGMSAYVLMFYFHQNRKRFFIYLPFLIGTCVATIYLRYHYLIDCVLGFILAYYCFRVSQRNVNFEEETP